MTSLPPWVPDAFQYIGRSTTNGPVLECTASERRPESRLSCQIKLVPELDGLVLHLPESQQ